VSRPFLLIWLRSVGAFCILWVQIPHRSGKAFSRLSYTYGCLCAKPLKVASLNQHNSVPDPCFFNRCFIQLHLFEQNLMEESACIFLAILTLELILLHLFLHFAQPCSSLQCLGISIFPGAWESRPGSPMALLVAWLVSGDWA